MEERDYDSLIDPDKMAENPGLLPYAHTVGSAIIRPIDKGRTKGLAMQAMYEQSDIQLTQIKQQVESLLTQAQKIHDRITISESIYEADCSFKPLIGNTYHLYLKKDGKKVLSMIAPNEWGKIKPYEYEASIRLLADHTWIIVEG